MDPNATLAELYSELFHDGGDYDRAVELAEALAEWISNDGFEPDECPCGGHWADYLSAAYWHLTEWHEGQTSDTYRALCVIGQVYTPGLTANGPEPESFEEDVYQLFEVLAGDRDQ